jgi:hypothetical protein
VSEDLRNKSTLEESPCISGKSACVHLHNKLLHAVGWLCLIFWNGGSNRLSLELPTEMYSLMD